MLGIPIASAAQPRADVSPKQSDGIPAIPGKSQVKRPLTPEANNTRNQAPSAQGLGSGCTLYVMFDSANNQASSLQRTAECADLPIVDVRIRELETAPASLWLLAI